MNVKVYQALKAAGRPEAACRKAAEAAHAKSAPKVPAPKKPWRDQLAEIE